jgi:hypothetical protein
MSKLKRAPLVCVCFSVTLSYAQYTTYSDVWAADNGSGGVTVWGSAYTEDIPGHGVQHNMYAGPVLYGPSSNNSNGGWGAGSVSVLAQLPEALGDFYTASTHHASCSADPSIPGSTQSATLTMEKSGYINTAGPTPYPNGVCTWEPSGTGCPGHCGQTHTTNSFGGQCYTPPSIYKQCTDYIKNGQCNHRVFCVAQAVQGYCT